MVKRDIITIDEKKCNGCGACIPGCPEGALQVIDGKARLISDLFCDGLGACLGTCPQGAITVENREAEPYNEFKVMDNVVLAGPNVIKAHLKHLKDHNEMVFYQQALDYLKERKMEVPDLSDTPNLACGCPGTMQKDLRNEKKEPAPVSNVNLQSKLNNWPIQLTLLNPNAPYLSNADLLIAADCTPFAYANFHERFLKDKILIMFCPKLDKNLDEYVDKLTAILKTQNIQSITLLHMEVPCCGGVEAIVTKALQNANVNIIIKDYTISINGELI